LSLRWSVVLALVSAWLLAGCATKGEVEALRQELRTSVAQFESLKGETRKQLEERERALAHDLKVLQETLAKLSETVKEDRAKLADVAAKSDAATRDVGEVRASMQAAHKVLADLLRGEEAQLKEALRLVQSLMTDLVGGRKPDAPPVK
jgi:septal ring factor EnvC (AmiA/AmiB activator)